MAIAFVNLVEKTAFGATSTGNLAAFNVTSGNFILVSVHVHSTISVTSITDTAGNTYTLLATNSPGSGWDQEVWGAHNVSGNANNVITINLDGTETSWGAIAGQYSGVKLTSALDVSSAKATAGAATSITSDSFTPTTSTGVAVSFVATSSGDNGSYTAGTNYTLRSSSGNTLTFEDRLSAPASSQTCSISWANSTNDNRMLVVVLKAEPTDLTLSGAPAVVFAAAGSPVAEKMITGAPAIAFGAAGNLEVDRLLSGTVLVSIGAAGSPETDALQLSGVVAILFGASGQLTGGFVDSRRRFFDPPPHAPATGFSDDPPKNPKIRYP